MATVTYNWDTLLLDWITVLSTNTELPGSQANPAVAALKNGSGFLAAWDQPGFELVDGRLVGGNVPLSPEYQLNSTSTNDQFDPSLATLSDGNVVLTFTDLSNDPGGDIRARLFTPAGTPVDLDFGVDEGGGVDADSDVAALADGGFVVSWTRDFIASNSDIRVQIFNSDGTPRTSVLAIDNDNNLFDASASQVAGLANGNVVVVWQQEPVGGGATAVYYRIRDANGIPITDAVPFDVGGSINEDVQVVALQDGGFAVAYTDNGWNGGLTGRDITVKIFNADGSERTSFLQANNPANGGVATGDQTKPTLTVLSNGYIVVGWTDGAMMKYQAYDPAGNPIGTNSNALAGAIEGDIAGLAGGVLACVQQNAGAFDGSANSIVSYLSALIRTTTGIGASETMVGDSLFDIMRALGGNDTISGGAGNDTLEGGSGNDRLNGGSGVDMASYSTASAAVKLDLAKAGAQNTGGAGTDTLISIESTTGSDFNDTLKGNAQANSISGGEGDDTIEGRGGNDTLYGGSGNDTASYASAKSGVTVSLALVGTAQDTGGAGKDFLVSFERLTGSAFNDVLTGDIFNNVLRGGAGRDRLDGDDNNDTLDGGSGKDTIDGGQGDDWASYASATSGVTVNLGIATAQNTGGGGIDRLIEIEHLIGSKFNDRLIGNSMNNDLSGGAGKDTLTGGGGDDTIDGGAGDDIMKGGAGTDLATYASAASGVKVSLAVAGAQNTLGAGTDTLSSFENLTGSRFNDRLTGNGDSNIIIGGEGKDTMKGGGGSDIFEYLSLSDSGASLSLRDLITDFGVGDKIDLSAIDADVTLGSNQSFHLDATPDGPGDIGIAFDAANNRTIITLYVDNNATADAAIMLSGDHSGLTAGDFFL
jgi:Ca2+-binding RTX toxin-like protein